MYSSGGPKKDIELLSTFCSAVTTDGSTRSVGESWEMTPTRPTPAKKH